jgi:hypothetical protein
MALHKQQIEPHSDATNRIIGSEEAGAFVEYQMEFEELPMNPGPPVIDHDDVSEDPGQAEMARLTRT